MKCFLNLKGILIKSRGHKSAPELKQQSKTDNSGSPVIPKSSAASFPRSLPDLNGEKAPNLRVFTFSDLRNATNNFSKFFKIGEGGFGCVYKGMIKAVDGQGGRIVVAIKKLNKDGFQGHKQWLAEVRLLGVVEHPNLVKLIGYCAVDGERGMQRLLVYEYVPNRSLEDHLFHQVIYRDFKASNVLLDNDFKPKLSDFGLAREGPEAGQTHVSTAVVGTHGYAAPDYIKTGHLTSKSDVWSFGVVLYEVLTGRRSLERDRPKKDRKLLDWVKRFPAESRKFCTIMDPRLDGQYSVTVARKLAQLADNCLLKSAKDRPTMIEVVNRLKQIMESSGEESDQEKTLESSEIDTESSDTVSTPMDASIATQRRMAHLAKLSDHVGGFSRRGAMIMQRAKVI